MAKQWERQNDTDKSWEAFVVYRDMGVSRTLQELVKALSKSRQMLGEWKSKYEWADRCKAYDNHIDKIRREAREKEIVERSRQREKESQTIQKMMSEIQYVTYKELMQKKIGDDGKSRYVNTMLKKDGTPKVSFSETSKVSTDKAMQERIEQGIGSGLEPSQEAVKGGTTNYIQINVVNKEDVQDVVKMAKELGIEDMIMESKDEAESS